MTDYRQRPAQQDDVLPGRKIVLVLAAIVLVIAAIVLISRHLLASREAVLRPSGQFPEKHLGPPHEVSSVKSVIFESEARGQSRNADARRFIDGYGWVDRPRRLIHIPVESAFDLLLDQERQERR